jgi:hypothetical protein
MDFPVESDLIIQSVIFGENGVEISFAERRDQSLQVALFKNIAIDMEFVKEEVEDVLDTLRDVVDKAHVILRNPPKKVRRREPLVDDEDEEVDESITS